MLEENPDPRTHEEQLAGSQKAATMPGCDFYKVFSSKKYVELQRTHPATGICALGFMKEQSVSRRFEKKSVTTLITQLLGVSVQE
jgi:hypothetical protein